MAQTAIPRGTINIIIDILIMITNAASCFTPSHPQYKLIISKAHHSKSNIRHEGIPYFRNSGILVIQKISGKIHDSLWIKSFLKCTYNVSPIQLIEYVVAVAIAIPTIFKSSTRMYK